MPELHAEPIRAPSLSGGEEWLNTEMPLTPEQLRGQVVLLDFWTYCCINCMHIFPDLKYLEKKYEKEPFLVIGVHSGKFEQEKDADNIRQAILRHNIEHPVVVDSRYIIWNNYAVKAWPTLVLVDPRGYVAGVWAGEGHLREIDRAVSRLLRKHRGDLADGPLELKTERESFESGILEFPGKILADASGDRLFISDTNHHRILMSDPAGKVQRIFGSGEIGLQDGPADDARFHQPQGLALSEDGRQLFVADTENHALRGIDLETGQVTTLAGTGVQSRNYRATGPGPKTALSSPWDLARVDNKLYIAMAGTHQIWVYDIERRRVAVFAGTGEESGQDGPTRKATFAQPSGLATDGRYLYIADAEISSIRIIDLKERRVETLAGSGRLFDFGHVNGVGRIARFQHPLGLALHENKLFVADTFNDALRVIDLDTKKVDDWPSDAKPSDKNKTFFEPGGLSIAAGRLYIADTNHHRIATMALNSPKLEILPLNIKPRKQE